MPITREIARNQLGTFFADFTRRFLTGMYQRAADVEVLEPTLGHQVPVEGARLLGITFDAGEESLELELDIGDHRIMDLDGVWILEEQDGFLSAIAVVHRDGSREVVSLKRVGLRRLH